MSNCDICGSPIHGRGRCRDCQRDQLAEDDAGGCAEDGCHEDTAFASQFCEAHNGS